MSSLGRPRTATRESGKADARLRELRLLILIGLSLRLALSFIARHGWDFWLNYETVKKAWQLGSLFDIYLAGQQMIQGAAQIWFYGPVSNLLLSWPPLLVRSFDSWNPFHVFLGHLPYVILEMGALLTILKAIGDLPTRLKFIKLFWLSPFWIFINYCYAQIDILGASLNLIGIAAAQSYINRSRSEPGSRWRIIAAAFFCALALHVKWGHGIGFVTVLLLLFCAETSWRRLLGSGCLFAVSYLLFGGAGILLGNALFEGYWAAVTKGPTIRLFFATPLWNISALKLAMVFGIGLALLSAGLNLVGRRRARPARNLVLDIAASFLLSFYLAVDFAPHWIVWSMPFWYLLLVQGSHLRAYLRVLISYAVMVVIAYDAYTSFRTFEIVLTKIVPGWEKLLNFWTEHCVRALSIHNASGMFCALLVAAVAMMTFYINRLELPGEEEAETEGIP